jgi:hypothetical protein
VGAALLLTLGAATAQAQAVVASDRGAGYVIFPKILSDPLDALNRGQVIDTIVQLTNLDPNDNHVVHCFYVNATGVCTAGTNAIDGLDCLRDADCGVGGRCNEDIWAETNFTITLTPRQPTGWIVSETREVDVVDNDPNTPGAGDGRILAVPTDLFLGELKCVEVNNVTDVVPINRNDLKGEASTYTITREPEDPNDPNSPDVNAAVDVRRYNAIGVQALSENGADQNDRTLCLGGNGIGGNVCATAEYASCPEKLIVNHLFADDDASGFTFPNVTLVPCTEQLATDEPTNLTIQILVFNEFEQRFSLSTQIECLADIRLDEFSILYDIGTQGTVAGQSIFRAVADATPENGGFGILGIAEQFTDKGSTAYNVVYSGSHAGVADFVSYVLPDTGDLD